jgi:glycosyltransferase involved in cell wall biosynthesis
MSAPKVLALYRDFDACFWWRIARPYERLSEAGGFYAHAHLDDTAVSNYAHLFDAVVLPRMSWEERHADRGRRFVDALHRAGLCVVYEVDDDVFTPGINARLRQTVQTDATPAQLEQRRQERLAALRLCDAVTVSSQRLATVVRSLVAPHVPVATIPNAIDARWWRGATKGRRRTIPGPVIGWAGGARPGDDMAALATAWCRIAARYPAVTFAVMGWQATEFDALPPGRLVRLPWVPLEEYPRALAQFDIACCSVVDNAFNRSKTPIKVWEATLSGAAVVATPTLYSSVVTHGADGLLAQTADEWAARLAYLLDNPAERKRLRRNQRRRIMQHHTLDQQSWRWPAAYQTILDQTRERIGIRRSLLSSTADAKGRWRSMRKYVGAMA